MTYHTLHLRVYALHFSGCATDFYVQMFRLNVKESPRGPYFDATLKDPRGHNNRLIITIVQPTTLYSTVGQPGVNLSVYGPEYPIVSNNNRSSAM
jgi:hypothetical protein